MNGLFNRSDHVSRSTLTAFQEPGAINSGLDVHAVMNLFVEISETNEFRHYEES